MDTSAFWAGLWLGTVIMWLLRERWQAARLAQLRRQLSDTERELWNAQRRATYWEAEAGDVRRGLAPPVPVSTRKKWQAPKADND